MADQAQTPPAAPAGAVESEVLAGSVGDFSILGLIAEADIVVKAVMAVLVLASIWSWMIIILTDWRVRRANGKASKFETLFWSGNSLDDLFESLKSHPNHPLASVFVAVMREWQRSTKKGALGIGKGTRPGVEVRIDRVLRVTIQREMERLEGRVAFLATVGSAAPFIGLLGTVWGIMNSFTQIANSANTSLEVVAPGIAEALFATALGLVAAIPAVVAYNKLSADLGRFSARLDGFGDEFAAILSRQIDEKMAA